MWKTSKRTGRATPVFTVELRTSLDSAKSSAIGCFSERREVTSTVLHMGCEEGPSIENYANRR